MTTITPAKGSTAWTRCWSSATHLNSFNSHELSAHCGVAVETCRGVIAAWKADGLVRSLGKRPPKNRVTFELIDPVARANKAMLRETILGTPTAASNMWAAIRGLTTFNPRDLAAHATSGEINVTLEDATEYCRLLLRGGYLRVVEKARPPHRLATYRLVRNTGPKPPAERRVRAVWDGNLGSYTHFPEPGQ